MIPEEKIQLLFQKIGQNVQSSSFLGKGEASVVMKVESDKGTYALKTALYPKRKDKVLREAQFRTFFIEKGLSFIPRPIHVDTEIFPNGAVIYEYADGSKPESISKETLIQFGQIIGEIHKIDFEIINDGYTQIQNTLQFLDKTIKSIKTRYPHLLNPLIDEAFAKAIDEYKKMISDKKELFTIGINAQLHGDLSDNYVVDNNGKIWLLDWENSERGDVLEELYWFLYVNNVKPENHSAFFKEYQRTFTPAQEINIEDLTDFYFAVTPVFNICWGIDQLDMNIKQNLEPERKLRDLADSAQNWIKFYSDTTTSLIIKGIETLKLKLS
ncbi:MAG: aminoglycoside phosphotransferase family protein [Candidatus Heimdallarchaeota archaeon]